ncbi:MAG: cytochrome c [Gammaproteobacteria bacterium]|nr:cytochrome c [Gammaproteobacteria bacterium]
MIKIKNGKTLLSIALLFSMASFTVAAELAGEALFKKKCSLCHSIEKKKLGPAIKTMSSEAETLRAVILKGKGMMPGFDGKLTSAQIDSLVEYLLVNQ